MTFRYRDININIEYRGDGAPVILLHGWGCDSSAFAQLAASLEPSYSLYIFDLPGFGTSDEPREVWGVADYTEMVRAFVEEQKLEHPVLMGHSFGGRISILYSSMYDARGVVLIDAAGIVPKRSAAYYFKVYSFKLRRMLCQTFLPKAKAEELLNRRRAQAGSSDYSRATPKMRAVLSKTVNEDLKHVMPSIKAPVLLFWGNLDTATPLADAKIMERLIPNTRLVVAIGCGHFAFQQSVGLFDSSVKKFLKDIA